MKSAFQMKNSLFSFEKQSGLNTGIIWNLR